MESFVAVLSNICHASVKSRKSTLGGSLGSISAGNARTFCFLRQERHDPSTRAIRYKSSELPVLSRSPTRPLTLGAPYFPTQILRARDDAVGSPQSFQLSPPRRIESTRAPLAGVMRPTACSRHSKTSSESGEVKSPGTRKTRPIAQAAILALRTSLSDSFPSGLAVTRSSICCGILPAGKESGKITRGWQPRAGLRSQAEPKINGMPGEKCPMS